MYIVQSLKGNTKSWKSSDIRNCASMSPPLRKCSSECSSENVTRDLTWYCHRCNCPIHLLCYGIRKDPVEIFVIDNIVMICDECMSNPKENSSPKRKQPNSTGNMIQQVINPTNATLSLTKTVTMPTPPKTVNVKQSQQMQAVIEALVQKVETQTATIAALKTSVDSMNSNVTQQNASVEKSIKINAENLSSINKVLIETPAVVQSAIKHTYATVVKGNETPRSSMRNNRSTPSSTKPNRTPRSIKPVVNGMSTKVIGKPISPDQNRRNVRSNGSTTNQKAIWVSGLHRDTTEQEIESYVKGLVGGASTDQFQIRKLVKKDRELSSYSFVSFKISCPESNFGTFLDPKNWPSNCRLREFEMDRQMSDGARLNNVNTTTPSSPRNPSGTENSKNEDAN